MQESPIDDTRRGYARLAGFLYLFVMATAVIGEVGTSMIRGSGDFTEVARRIVASEQLYRVALSSTAICAVAALVLTCALYVILEPVNKWLAQLALCARAGEAFIIGAVRVFRFAAQRLYAPAWVTGPFHNDQLQLLVSLAGRAYGSGVQVGEATPDEAGAHVDWWPTQATLSSCRPWPRSSDG
jgi:hypothetical protein